jgi:uncharacterized membrane protein
MLQQIINLPLSSLLEVVVHPPGHILGRMLLLMRDIFIFIMVVTMMTMTMIGWRRRRKGRRRRGRTRM